MDLSGQSILVTGAAGFIGSNFVRYCLANQAKKIVSLDKLSYAGHIENLAAVSGDPRHEFVKDDIANKDAVLDILRAADITSVVNFAAETHVDRSILSAEPFIHSNVVGVCRLLEATQEYLRERQAEDVAGFRFLHISTDEIYGSLGLEDAGKVETDAFMPNSPYSASKASANHIVRAFRETHGLPTLITNCTNNYGPFQYPEKLIPLVVVNGTLGKEIPLYGDGSNIRDWMYVDDHCEAILSVLTQGDLGETYNISSGEEINNKTIVETICDLLDSKLGHDGRAGRRALIKQVADRPGHDFRYSLNAEKLQQHTGWRPRTPFEEGISKTIDWYIEHSDWVSSLIGDDKYERWMSDNYALRSAS